VALRDEQVSGRVEAMGSRAGGGGKRRSPWEIWELAGQVVLRMGAWGRLEVGVGNAGEIGDSSGKEE
jgi:hypothetical protein